MGDRHLLRLVEQIERAFPDDLDEQRHAWEFIELVMTAWDEASAPTFAATPSEAPAESATAAAGRRLLDACRSLLRDAGGRLASTVEVLVPVEPRIRTLSRGDEGLTIEMDADVADVLGVERSIAVEYGTDYVTLIVHIGKSTVPSRLAAILHTADEEMTVRRFESVEPTIATAHFEFPATRGPIGVVVAVFDQES